MNEIRVDLGPQLIAGNTSLYYVLEFQHMHLLAHNLFMSIFVCIMIYLWQISMIVQLVVII